MKCIKNKILSWEPLEIRFVPKKKKKDWDKEVFMWIQGWEKDRMTIAGDLETSQLPLECYVAEVAPDGTVVVHIEWLCERSIDIFADYIRKKGSNVKQLIIDDKIDEALPVEEIGLEIQFIQVPEKIIYTETQSDIAVPSFEISRYPITVGQYKKFTEETNYKTTNEKTGYYLTYFDNDILIGMGKKEKMSTVATCLSFNDATEYCKWTDVRLPNDHEWLSAAILDWESEYEEDDITEEDWDKYTSQLVALKRISSEWINEYNPNDDTSVIRYGPGYFLKKGWRRKKLRKKHPANHTDLLLQFRVCKIG